MHFIRRPVASLQVPNFQVPAIIIAGQPDMPPPLDTYLFHGSDLADSALIWMTADPNVFQFMVQADDGFGTTHLYTGYVFGGAVVEQAPVVPMGIRQSINLGGITDGRWFEGSLLFKAGTTINIQSGTGNLELYSSSGVVRSGTGILPQQAIGTSNQNTRGLSGAGTTTSAAFVAMPGTPGLTIDKYYPAADTSLTCRCSYTLFSTVNGTDIRLGVRISGTDTEIIQFFPTNANERYQTSGEVKVPGLAAGNYVVALVWRRASGTGTLTVSALDSFSFTVEEIAA